MNKAFKNDGIKKNVNDEYNHVRKDGKDTDDTGRTMKNKKSEKGTQ